MVAELKTYLDAMERRADKREQSLREYIDERTHDASRTLTPPPPSIWMPSKSKLLELETRTITLEKPGA